MRLAVIFSGQGGQQPEHLERLKREATNGFREGLVETLPMLWNASDPDTELLLCNRAAQPLIFGFQMLLWQQLGGFLPRPVCVAGYSLGEMAACAAVGIFSAEDGLRLCAQRATLMDQAYDGPAGLLAVLGLNEQAVRAIADHCGVYPAIRNAATHWVLGGPREALRAARQLAEAQGAIRTIVLGVSTPSHTPLLTSAAEAFATVLAPWRSAQRLAFPVLSAVDGRSAYRGDAAIDALSRQIATPLDWEACLRTLIEMQPDKVLEIGPGNAMTKLVGEQAPALTCRSTSDFRTLEGIRDWLSASR